MSLAKAIFLAFILVLLNSCSKERLLPGASLNFRFSDMSEDVEWLEVVGGRNQHTGDCYIKASGFDSEQFHLELINILSTGTVQNVTAKNISYSNIYGFTTGGLQSVQIVIEDINSHKVQGRFTAAFVNRSNNTDIIKATGNFTIYGSEP